MGAQILQEKISFVVGHTSQGQEIRAGLLRLTRFQAVLEIYNPTLVLQTSEVLQELRIVLFDKVLYSGRGLVSSVVNTGALLVAEVKLDDRFFAPTVEPSKPLNGDHNGDFKQFLEQWQKLYRVRPDFKVVVADMQTFLSDLRLWLEQVELEIRSAPSGSRMEMEKEMAAELGDKMVPAFNALHERFEEISSGIEEDLRPVHQSFCKRQLHPLVMCSPFAYRTFHKPLGYAGDYEMVNMMARDPHEGGSLFAKVANRWFLSQWPAQAHRNRLKTLKTLFEREALRAVQLRKPLKVLNLGCGPAREVQEFLTENPLADWMEFQLLDFNDETVEYTSRVLNELCRVHGRKTRIRVQKKSVNQILKEAAKTWAGVKGERWDFIYCAGLFDYLSDRICKQLMGVFHGWLAPEGLLVATNVNPAKPFRHMLEFVLDWHLIYREPKILESFVPAHAAQDERRVEGDSTGVNVFLELRKAGP
jgi:extracellular factor (EF) 3-hydroxypalmitic acid methyl ester biosynthesis protein